MEALSQDAKARFRFPLAWHGSGYTPYSMLTREVTVISPLTTMAKDQEDAALAPKTARASGRRAAGVGRQGRSPRLPPSLSLVSADDSLADLVARTIMPPWKISRHRKWASKEVFRAPNVRLVVLDDEIVSESDRHSVLAQLRTYVPSASVLYVAGSHSNENEKRARSNGAHYYASKPISADHFGYVLRSFLSARLDR